MKHSVRFVVLFVAATFTATTAFTAALAQDPSQTASSSTAATAPVAYVYISAGSGSSAYKINQFSASSSGALSDIAPAISTNGVSFMAVNGKWLFGANGTDIYSFSIASNGSLKQVSSIDAAHYNAGDTGGPENLFLDHTGANLYDFDIYGDGTGNNTFQSFDINQNSGVLSYTGTTPGSSYFQGPLSFIGNNQYAYGASCYHGFQSIYGFSRSGSGTLTDLNINPNIPTAPSGYGYCPYLAAADPSDHVAITMTPTKDGLNPVAPTQLAVYTANGEGNLTTTSTDANMPRVKVGNVNDIWMAPSGLLLAVAGQSGLQVFHFNGANPITSYTGLLTSDNITQVFWDNNNHLYAVSPAAGKLFIFTVTPTSYSQAPGSPHSIPNALNEIVLPK